MNHLRDYQREALEDLAKRWNSGASRVPMVLATGLGKTEIFTALENQWINLLAEAYSLGKRVLVLAHTDELIEQAARKARLRNPGLTVGIVKAGLNQAHCQIVISSRQTLASEKRRAAIRGVGLIIVDECHHALRSNTYGKILEHFGAWDSRVKVAGFTATLARGDKGKLSTVWEEVTFRRDILFGIRRGYLLDVRGERIIIPDFDLQNVKKVAGDYSDSSLADELLRTHAPENVAREYKKRAGDRLGLAFWPLVETAYDAAKAFNAEGIPSAVVHGGLPREERKLTLKRFHEGEIQVVHNCMVLTEGFDEPRADVVVVGRPTKSAPLYQQIVGRVLRPDLTIPAEKREKALILDVVGAGSNNDLRSLIDLSPERPLTRDDEEELSLLEMEDWLLQDETSKGNNFELEDEIYRGDTDVVAFDPLHRDRMWDQTPGGTFYMSAGTAQYVFLYETEPALWSVVWCTKQGAIKAGMTQYVSLPLEEALLWAEEEAIERGGHGTKTLTSRKAKWRQEAPTDAQLRLAQARGINTEGMNKGEVSEALDSITAARRIDALVKIVREKMS